MLLAIGYWLLVVGYWHWPIEQGQFTWGSRLRNLLIDYELFNENFSHPLQLIQRM
jgi:hypothetical protein